MEWFWIFCVPFRHPSSSHCALQREHRSVKCSSLPLPVSQRGELCGERRVGNVAEGLPDPLRGSAPTLGISMVYLRSRAKGSPKEKEGDGHGAVTGYYVNLLRVKMQGICKNKSNPLGGYFHLFHTVRMNHYP